MGDPGRVVRLEWRKMRRTGMTSHSWLEVYLLDGSRLKLETYADTGYTESTRAATDKLEGTLYERRAAEMQDLVGHLTADRLKETARAIGNERPYSLSEFNCHHFVLEVWNSITTERMRATHYPDRTKVNLLWGLEGTGSLLDGLRKTSFTSQPQVVEEGFAVRTYKAQSRDEPRYDATIRRKHFEEALANGLVFILDVRSSELNPASLPTGSRRGSNYAETWTRQHFPNVFSAASNLLERIGPLDLSMLTSQLSLDSAPSATASTNYSPFAFLSSMASVASVSSVSQSSARRKGYYPCDACFLLLDGEELRVVIYAILQSIDDPAQISILRVVSGNALCNEEASLRYSLYNLPDGLGISAADVAEEELPRLQLAVRSCEFESLLTRR